MLVCMYVTCVCVDICMNVRISKCYLLMAAAQEPPSDATPAAKDEKVPAVKSPEATVTTVHKYLCL